MEPSPQESDCLDQEMLTSRKRSLEEPTRRIVTSNEPMRGPGHVKRQIHEVETRVSDHEMDRLTREAIKTIRRMEREERLRSTATSSASSSSQSGMQGSPAMPSQTSAVDPRLVPVPEADIEEEVEVNRPLETSLVNNTANFFAFELINESGPNLPAKPVNTKNGEFNMKNATKEEIKGFLLSDVAEWKAIEELGAVRVHHGPEAEKIRKENPLRVLSSRMIRRKKPMPGIGQFKFKSRWCVADHQDPDTGKYQTFSPHYVFPDLLEHGFWTIFRRYQKRFLPSRQVG